MAILGTYNDDDATTADDKVLTHAADGSTKLTPMSQLKGYIEDNKTAGSTVTDDIADKAVIGEKLGVPIAFRCTPTGNTGNLAPSIKTTYTEVFDLGSNFTSGLFTAPYDGVYFFSIAHGVDNVASRVYNFLQLNGTTTIAEGFASGVASNHDPIAVCSRLIQLTAGNTIGAAFGAESAVALSGTPTFFGYLIGRTD